MDSTKLLGRPGLTVLRARGEPNILHLPDPLSSGRADRTHCGAGTGRTQPKTPPLQAFIERTLGPSDPRRQKPPLGANLIFLCVYVGGGGRSFYPQSTDFPGDSSNLWGEIAHPQSRSGRVIFFVYPRLPRGLRRVGRTHCSTVLWSPSSPKHHHDKHSYIERTLRSEAPATTKPPSTRLGPSSPPGVVRTSDAKLAPLSSSSSRPYGLRPSANKNRSG